MHRWRRALRLGLPIAIVVAVGFTLLHIDRHALALLLAPRSLPYLGLATAANTAAIVFSMLAWRVLLITGTVRLSRRAACRIFGTSLLTKYLPGRLWALALHISMGRAMGIGASPMTSAFMLSLAVLVLAGGGVASVDGPARFGAGAFWLAVPVGLLAVCFARPALVGRGYTAVVRLLRALRRGLRSEPAFSPAATGDPAGTTPGQGALRCSIAASLAYWVLSGAALWAIVVMLGARPLPALPACLGGFALASLVGGFVVFLPDGWGARELALATALSGVLPWTAAGVAAVASRAVCVITEVGLGTGCFLATAPSRGGVTERGSEETWVNAS